VVVAVEQDNLQKLPQQWAKHSQDLVVEDQALMADILVLPEQMDL
jgi:hypothetical protein